MRPRGASKETLSAVVMDLETRRMQTDGVFYASYPQPAFPAISLTGQNCELNCKHCMGRYLRSMLPCTRPEELLRLGLRLASRGAKGLLVSGGFNSEGHVPLAPFLGALRELKRETGLFLNVHTGLLPKPLIEGLAVAEVDMVSLDLVGSEETLRFVYGLRKGVEDYLETFRAMRSRGLYVVPHLCIGLHGGRLVGERKALELAAGLEVDAFVFLVLVPTPGTPFAGVSPPTLREISQLFGEARGILPGVRLILGCMRPRGRLGEEIESLALRAGFQRVALPSARTVALAGSMGLEVRRLEACCAVPV
jgi:uncharacterized radical SAM superfamily protein